MYAYGDGTGLLAVAGVLREAGHEVFLIDCLDRAHPEAPAPQSHCELYGYGQYLKAGLSRPPPIAHVQPHWGRYGLPREVFEAERCLCPSCVLITSAGTGLRMPWWLAFS